MKALFGLVLVLTACNQAKAEDPGEITFPKEVTALSCVSTMQGAYGSSTQPVCLVCYGSVCRKVEL